MTSPPRPRAKPLSSDPHLAPSPLPSGAALVRGAALALALGVAACGDDDTIVTPAVPDLGADLGGDSGDGAISPMPGPLDLGADDLGAADLGADDLGADDLGTDLGTDLGIIAPMPPPLDSGVIAPMPPPPDPPMPPPMPAPLPALPE